MSYANGFQPAHNKDGSPIPEGVYVASVKQIVPAQAQNGDTYVQWTFTIEEVRYTDDQNIDHAALVGEELWGSSSMAMGPRAKGRRWWEGLYGRPLLNGELPDPGMVRGRKVLVKVAEYALVSGGTKVGLVDVKSVDSNNPVSPPQQASAPPQQPVQQQGQTPHLSFEQQQPQSQPQQSQSQNAFDQQMQNTQPQQSPQQQQQMPAGGHIQNEPF